MHPFLRAESGSPCQLTVTTESLPGAALPPYLIFLLHLPLLLPDLSCNNTLTNISISAAPHRCIGWLCQLHHELQPPKRHPSRKLHRLLHCNRRSGRVHRFKHQDPGRRNCVLRHWFVLCLGLGCGCLHRQMFQRCARTVLQQQLGLAQQTQRTIHPHIQQHRGCWNRLQELTKCGRQHHGQVRRQERKRDRHPEQPSAADCATQQRPLAGPPLLCGLHNCHSANLHTSSVRCCRH